MHARITGWGKYLPERILTNSDLEKMVDTSDEWILSRSGIRERRMASDEEAASTLAAEAGRRALEVAGLSADELDLIIVGTNSPDKINPASAFLVQNALGASKAAAFDVVAGCCGFLCALSVAYQFVQNGSYRNVLVAGSEVLTRLINWEDRTTCVLFGDGAGAVVVQANESATDLLSFVMGANGAGAHVLYIPGPCDRLADAPEDRRYYVIMEGREVFKFAVTTMPEASRQAVQAAGLEISDIDLFIPHQANTRIIDSSAKGLGISADKVFVNVDRYGNLSAASCAVALCEAVEMGRLTPGDLVVLVAFGAGLSWAALVLRWQPGT
ncbi:MAG: beta-ketoacyl-ACP synthase III [Chloroflexota bacterium]|nr:beta-ketoacyl-ACP synthase III [Chloroflexota bacterium]